MTNHHDLTNLTITNHFFMKHYKRANRLIWTRTRFVKNQVQSNTLISLNRPKFNTKLITQHFLQLLTIKSNNTFNLTKSLPWPTWSPLNLVSGHLFYWINIYTNIALLTLKWLLNLTQISNGNLKQLYNFSLVKILTKKSLSAKLLLKNTTAL